MSSRERAELLEWERKHRARGPLGDLPKRPMGHRWPTTPAEINANKKIRATLNELKQSLLIDLSGDTHKQIKEGLKEALLEDHATSEEALETITAKLEAAKGAVITAEAAVETANNNLNEMEAGPPQATNFWGNPLDDAKAAVATAKAALVAANVTVANADAALVAVNEELITIRLSLDVITLKDFNIEQFEVTLEQFKNISNQENPPGRPGPIPGRGRRRGLQFKLAF